MRSNLGAWMPTTAEDPLSIGSTMAKHQWRKLHTKAKDCREGDCDLDPGENVCPCLVCEKCHWLDCEVTQNSQCSGEHEHLCNQCGNFVDCDTDKCKNPTEPLTCKECGDFDR